MHSLSLRETVLPLQILEMVSAKSTVYWDAFLTQMPFSPLTLMLFLLLLLISCPVVSDFLQPHGLQHIRLACPSSSLGVCPSSCLLHRWCRPAISSSDALFSFCPQSFPASGTFSVSCLFTSDNQIVELQL